MRYYEANPFPDKRGRREQCFEILEENMETLKKNKKALKEKREFDAHEKNHPDDWDEDEWQKEYQAILKENKATLKENKEVLEEQQKLDTNTRICPECDQATSDDLEWHPVAGMCISCEGVKRADEAKLLHRASLIYLAVVLAVGFAFGWAIAALAT